MRKWFATMLCAIMLLPAFTSYSQTYDYKLYLNKIAKAQKYKYNSVTVLRFKSENTKKGKVILFEKYDSLGNIQTKVEHDFNRYKDYSTTTFTYNFKKQLVGYTNKISFSRGYVSDVEIGYTKSGEIDYMKDGYGKPGEINYRTIYYVYKSDTAMGYVYKPGRGDTIYYKRVPEAGISYKVGSDAPIITKEQVNNTSVITSVYNDERMVTVVDSLGNTLAHNWDFNIKGQWQPVERYWAVYKDTLCVESEDKMCPNIEMWRCHGNLKLEHRIKYEYTPQGLPAKRIYYNTRGKVKYIEVYKYEY